MGSRVPDHLIAEVRERTDIAEVIGRYVVLRRAGSSLKGLCPFHEEKTPSFHVSPAKQFYHCFGCGESGDVFSFLQKIEGKPFFEVLQDLAGAAGVELPKPKQSPDAARRDSEREQCFGLNATAAEFFERALASSAGRAAKDYLASRRIEARTAAAFRLGYAPAGWDALTRHLARQGAPAALCEKLGLVARRRGAPARRGPAETVSPDRHFDFFRDRLVFPILGPGDRVLGFSARLLDPEAKARKYVNSPESPVYRKSEVLYGLPQARPAIRRVGRVILVEGNLDVLAMWQEGFEETVAPLGTALTARQVSILRRYAGEVVVAYDGDSAGVAAARKAAELLAAEPLLSRIALLPEGQDPADLVLSLKEQMRQILEQAPTSRRFLIDAISAEAGETVEERVRAAERLAEVLRRIPGAVEREEYARIAAASLGLRPRQLAQMMRARGGGRREAAAALRNAPGPDRPSEAVADRRLALALLALLVSHPHLAQRAEQAGVASYIEDPLGRDLVRHAIESQARSGVVDSAALLARVPEPDRAEVAESLMSDAFGAAEEGQEGGTVDPSRAFEQIFVRFRLTRMERDLKNLEKAIREAEQRDDPESRRELIRRRIRLSQERDELTRKVARGL